MQKIYAFFIALLVCFAASSQTITLKCVKDVQLNADSTRCSRVVYGIDPILPNGVSINRVSYHLDGVTKGDGTGSASGLAFNAGVTKVTYSFPGNPVLQCSFIVTIVSIHFVYPEVTSLPDLRGNCSVIIIKTPIAINKCTG